MAVWIPPECHALLLKMLLCLHWSRHSKSEPYGLNWKLSSWPYTVNSNAFVVLREDLSAPLGPDDHIFYVHYKNPMANPAANEFFLIHCSKQQKSNFADLCLSLTATSALESDSSAEFTTYLAPDWALLTIYVSLGPSSYAQTVPKIDSDHFPSLLQ